MFYLRETKLTSCEKEILIDLENRYVIYRNIIQVFFFCFSKLGLEFKFNPRVKCSSTV